MNKAKLPPDGRPVRCATFGNQLAAGIEYSSRDEEFSFHYSRPWWSGNYGFPLSPHIL
jgi:hypothetical protein